MLFPALPFQVSDALIRKVMQRVTVNRQTGCWIVAGATNVSGYATISNGRHRRLRVHRLLYLFEFGGIPPGLFVLHRCDVRRCCRPDHLFEGTDADNAADRVAKGRSRGSGLRKLSRRQVGYILRSDRPAVELARRYGVTPKTIRSWRRKGALPAPAQSHRVRSSRPRATVALAGQLQLL